MLFLKSSTRWRHIDKLAAFLGVDPKIFPDDAREEHLRKSTKPLQASTAAVMETLYANLTRIQTTLGEFHIVPRVMEVESSLSATKESLADALTVTTTQVAVDPTLQQVVARASAMESMHVLLLWSNLFLLVLTVTMFVWICRDRRMKLMYVF